MQRSSPPILFHQKAFESIKLALTIQTHCLSSTIPSKRKAGQSAPRSYVSSCPAFGDCRPPGRGQSHLPHLHISTNLIGTDAPNGLLYSAPLKFEGPTSARTLFEIHSFKISERLPWPCLFYHTPQFAD
ncbi:hypothetical protein HNY73_004674 [Argiope bruennichi]|uniref:Uncharacterized protein n=1 Tax=Argiope bruennichi TaxID=94029 RepID=A0A8T0FPP8_ARGBR|nr:hypothetical protein HNY73_004674 [Argiope bruennichi]